MSNLINANLLTVELFNRWRSLIGEAIGSNLDSLPVEEIDRMKDLHNKLALTVLTQERYLLAVTGLQGAGKTALVKRLYNLDGTYLRDNDGRGEKRPILITESDVSEPTGYVSKSNYTVEHGLVIHSEFVTPDEFDRIAKSPKKEEIWLELKVPFRHFHDKKKSLILLPGFEKDKEELSQQLLEHVLYLSTSSIVVFRKDTFARVNNLEMMNRIKEIYDNVKPIYVLTHGDVNSENNEKIIEQFIDMVQVDSTETDRVIMSGDPALFGGSWIKEVINMIGKYAFLTDESEQKKVALLESLFGDIRNEICSLEEFFRRQEEKAILSDQNSFEKNTYRLVEQFEVMYERILNDLEKNILDSLQGRKEKAKEYFNTYVKENEGFWKGVLNKFSPNALKDEEKLQAAIKEAWMEVGDTKPEVDIINVTTDYIEERANLLKDPIVQEQVAAAPKKEKANRFKLSGLENKTEETPKREYGVKVKEKSKSISLADAKKMTSLQRIDTFFAKNREKGELIPLYRDDLKMLTLMGTMLCRQGLYEKKLWEQNASEVGSQEAVAFNTTEDIQTNALDKTIDGMKDFSGKVSDFIPLILKTIPLVLGVDVVLDGQADLVLHATKALTGIGLTVTPLQLLGAIGGAAVLVYGINAVQHAVHDTNQRQLKLARAGHHAINQIPEIQTKAYIQSLRQVFEKMADHLAEVHKERLGEYDNDAQIESIRYSLRRIKLLNNQLQKMVYEHAPVVI